MALRLQASLHCPPSKPDVLGSTVEIANEPLPPTKGDRDGHSFSTKEVFTPGGLPIRIAVEILAQYGRLYVFSADTRLLLTLGGRDLYVEMWLSTDEKLIIQVHELSERLEKIVYGGE